MFHKLTIAREIKNRTRDARPALYRLALSWCNDPYLADDLTQESTERALKKYRQLRDINKFESWLFSILNNCWRDHLRRLRPTEDIDELVLYAEGSAETGLEQAQIANRVKLAIEKLPIGQRQVVTLVDLQEMSYAEVAEILNIPTGTVMSRLSRARQNLKQSLLSLHREVSPENRLRVVK